VIPGAELTVVFHGLFRLGAGIGFPAHPVIISGGHIHVDVASLQEHLEASPPILEVTPGAPTGFDAELTERLHRTFGSRVEIRTAAFVTAIVRLGDGYRVGTDDAVVTGDVVMEPGRHVVLPEGVEQVGLDPATSLAADRQLRTSNPHVYAPDDGNAKSMRCWPRLERRQRLLGE
jgi:pyruvate/2-oxoglutarate dehydrogenase complex dihydrolipoamide dehydrogenase (E3) component